MIQYFFSMMAGIVSILSPCVLPLVPIMLGSAMMKHKAGPLALTAGLTASTAFFGILIALAGQSLGLDKETIRIGSAIMLGLFGLFMLSKTAQDWLARVLAPFSNKANDTIGAIGTDGLWGQFMLGAMVGAVWTPCSGPTLGAAVTLATQTDTAFQAAIMMMMFSIGASLPMLALSYGSRAAIMSRRNSMMAVGGRAKTAMGAILVGMCVMILSGADRSIEVLWTNNMPDWALNIVSSY